MTGRYVKKIRVQGHDRFSVVLVESLPQFNDLVNLVSQLLGGSEVAREEGPGTIVSRIESSRGELLVVLGDMTGAHIQPIDNAGMSLASEVAAKIEERFIELCG